MAKPDLSWLDDLPGDAGTIGDALASFNVWLPIGAATVVLAFIVAAAAVSLGIHIARMVISHVSGGGGSV